VPDQLHAPVVAARLPRRLLRASALVASALALAAFASPAHAQSACDADTNDDGTVDSADLGTLLSAWGPCSGCAGDLNRDGQVDSADLGALLSLWGAPCNPVDWAEVLQETPTAKDIRDPVIREAIIATGLPWKVRDTASDVEMLLVPTSFGSGFNPPDTFEMGCSPSVQFNCAGDESPVHAVTLSEPYYIGRFELTQDEWTSALGTNPSGSTVDANAPVEQFSWNELQYYLAKTGLRLPTEAEWEHAYRAGSRRAFNLPPEGSDSDADASQIAWFEANSGGRTSRVGELTPNGFALYDMSGNVAELVSDRYSDAYYASSPDTDPRGSLAGEFRVLRGGSFADSTDELRASNRVKIEPAARATTVGVRVARSATSSAPTVASLSPTSGPTAGGTMVTITGTNFDETASALIGTEPLVDVTVVSPTTITALVPSGAAGMRDIVVSTWGGAGARGNAFTYVDPPAVSSVFPAAGPVAGGTSITITGSGFAAPMSVTIGGVPASDVTILSPSTLRAVTPSGAVGARNIVVTSPFGTSSAGAFTYVAQPVRTIVLEQDVDPAVVTNASLRDAIRATGLPWRVRDTVTAVEMVLVPAGSFQMGCSPTAGGSCDTVEEPIHTVTLTRPYYIGRYEVTQWQWTSYAGWNPSYFQGSAFPDAPVRPVESMTNVVAASFLDTAGLRLPTEAEWEYAYRAGTSTAFHSTPTSPDGTDDASTVGSVAWFNLNSCGGTECQTSPVGLKAPNALGIHDMAGNVSEHVSDWWSATYYGSSPATDPTGPASPTEPNGQPTVVRGGSWSDSPYQLRASFRAPINYTTQSSRTGVRAARLAQIPAPVVSSMSEWGGPPAGGQRIEIRGTDLYDTVAVSIGGVPATGLLVIGTGRVDVTVPPGTLGPKDVVVTTASGSASAPYPYTYMERPVVASASPNFSHVNGGTLVTLTGSNFSAAQVVRLLNTGPAGGGVDVIPTILNDTTIRFTAPANTVGLKTIGVYNIGGWGYRANAFAYVNVPAWASVIEATPNPTVVTNPALREAIIATGRPWHVRDPDSGAELMLIPPGSFNMGCAPSIDFGACSFDEFPVHPVTISQPFYMGRFEITQALWTQRMNSNPSHFNFETSEVMLDWIDRRPVERVNWDMAHSFMAGTGLRLPTEAEWEYAYRAGTTTAFHGWIGSPDGTNVDAQALNLGWTFWNAAAQTHPVGQKAPNGFGLYDMVGNVSEWVSDFYSQTYYSESPFVDPQGPSGGSLRSLRGGSFFEESGLSRGSRRLFASPTAVSNRWGFRVARNP